MKLLENQKMLYPGEGLSLEQICANGCKAYFEGRVDEGCALFELLNPGDGDVYVRAHCFLSQVLSFCRRFDEALDCINHLVEHFPKHANVLHQACLIHSYRREYERAFDFLGAYAPEPHDEAGYYYQAACLLAVRKDYEASLLALSISLEAGGYIYFAKIWYDPELVFLWEGLPEVAHKPEIHRLLLRRYWPDLLASYDTEAPFDYLDPGNLRSFSIEDMQFVSVRPQGPMAFLVPSRRSNDPEAYDALIERLHRQRERSVSGLRQALQQVEADAGI